jgi:Uma2 family endonuclease
MSSILDNPAVRRAALPITVDQYHRLGEAGIIGQNTELLRGIILEKMIKSPQHTWIVQWLARRLGERLPAGVHLRQEQPLTLADSEPEPDIAIVSGTPDDFRHEHPSTAVLVIEVAISSVEVDHEKAQLYAAAGVNEYWLILPGRRVAEVHTNPSDSGYDRRQSYTDQETVFPQDLPACTVELNRIF